MVYGDGVTQHGFEMERIVGPNAITVLNSFARAWNLNATIFKMKSEQQFTYAWYLKDGDISLLLGWIDNPNNIFAFRESPKLLVGKLNRSGSSPSGVALRPGSNFVTLASFSLRSPDVFNEACEWIDINWQKFTLNS